MMLVIFLVFSCFIEVYHAQSQANYTDISELFTMKLSIDNKTCEFKPISLNYSSSLRISERSPTKAFPSLTIANGHLAQRNEFPHMGAVGWKAKDSSVGWVFKCGSTLISEKFLLTAAHCSKLSLESVSDVIQSEPEIVRLGDINISYKRTPLKRISGWVVYDPTFDDFKINLIITHPKYASPKKYYDIALIELQQEVNFTPYKFPARLWPNDNFNELGNESFITGWGYNEHGLQPEILQVGAIHVFETSVCKELFTQYNRNWHGIEDHQICAGELAGGSETCQGDSGGPLQIEMPYKRKFTKYYWLLGVTSFGISCKRKERKDQNRLGIYTRVSSFINWIEEVVWKPIK